ncbi:MAG: hypothetical protein H6842_06820 [Rhodospirillaceae bacterium]|nr:hypothetical protein [Rhodospirillaceae bacterium]
MTTETRWRPLDLSGLQDRLEQARLLLEQAALLAATRDGDRVSALADLHRRIAEEHRADPHRQRYR